MTYKKYLKVDLYLLLVLTFLFHSFLFSQTKKALSLQDIMKFNHIHSAVISNDGSWIAYNIQPDRGDGKAPIQSTNSKKKFAIERGDKPIISNNSRWVAAFVKPKFIELEKNKKNNPGQHPENKNQKGCFRDSRPK